MGTILRSEDFFCWSSQPLKASLRVNEVLRLRLDRVSLGLGLGLGFAT